MVSTRDIQQRLTELGFNPGPIDGVRGRQTIKAIKQYQAAEGLAVDGVVGPITRSRLFGGEAGQPMGLEPDIPWYDEARRLTGVTEVAGNKNNKTIMDWADDLDIHYPGDEVPWCGLFVAHCIGQTLPEEALPPNPLGARNWRKFGRHCEPTKGCVLVFWRTHPTNSFNGHVGFYAGQDDTAYFVLGGNQSNSVNVVRVAKTRFLEARFPSTAVLGERQIVELSMNSDLSTDEA